MIILHEYLFVTFVMVAFWKNREELCEISRISRKSGEVVSRRKRNNQQHHMDQLSKYIGILSLTSYHSSPFPPFPPFYLPSFVLGINSLLINCRPWAICNPCNHSCYPTLCILYIITAHTKIGVVRYSLFIELSNIEETQI